MLTFQRLILRAESRISVKAGKYLIHIFLVLFIFSLVSCGFTKKIKLDPDSQNFYETARLIMSGKERDIFRHLPDKESREEFIKDFWVKRDPDPDTEENEFKEEFFRRIQYANERFKEGIPGWKTDRGRIYIYFGPPDRFEQRPMLNNPNVKGYIIWIYYRYALAIQFLDRRGDGSYTIDTDPYEGGIYGSFFDALERAKFGLVYQEDESGKTLVDFDLKYHRERKEFVISIPVKTITFIEEEGNLRADFDFEFSVYRKKGGKKQSFQETRHFKKPEEEILKMKDVVFVFTLEDLEAGKYYFDVIIIGKEGIGKTRRIFNIKI